MGGARGGEPRQSLPARANDRSVATCAGAATGAKAGAVVAVSAGAMPAQPENGQLRQAGQDAPSAGDTGASDGSWIVVRPWPVQMTRVVGAGAALAGASACSGLSR